MLACVLSWIAAGLGAWLGAGLGAGCLLEFCWAGSWLCWGCVLACAGAVLCAELMTGWVEAEGWAVCWTGCWGCMLAWAGFWAMGLLSWDCGLEAREG